MELYNFFSHVAETDDDKENLEICFEELKPLCLNVQLVIRTNIHGTEQYTIIGQIYGDDTNAGDLSLLSIFYNIEYTWFDAFCPSINNLNSKQLTCQEKQ